MDGSPQQAVLTPRASPPGEAPIIEVLSAEKTFGNGTRALAPVQLAIEKGEFVSLIGPSGCGKSTLLKLIANLIEPTDGKLSWWRGDFSRVGEPGRRLAFVFQEPTLMPWARVERNVRLPLGRQGAGTGRFAEIGPVVSAAAFGRHEDAGVDRAGDGDGA